MFKKDDKKSLEETTDLLQELMVNEIVEVLSPIMYLLCFITAYYGPNADDIGNIKNSTWHFRAFYDVGTSIGLIFLFFCVGCNQWFYQLSFVVEVLSNQSLPSVSGDSNGIRIQLYHQLYIHILLRKYLTNARKFHNPFTVK